VGSHFGFARINLNTLSPLDSLDEGWGYDILIRLSARS